MQAKKCLSGSSQKQSTLDISDVFSTYVYTGNGSTQDIVNGINLADDGGMVWIKIRDAVYDNELFDTERGATKALISNQTYNEQTETSMLTAFNNDGFTLGASGGVNSGGGNPYVSWTFKKQPRFFDVVKYTGNSVAGREIAHDLCCDVGMILIKVTNVDSGLGWFVYHRGTDATNPEQKWLKLETTDAVIDNALVPWNDTAPTDSVFTVSSYAGVNEVGKEYIAYLFAHDPLGPSVDGSDGMIACGSYVGGGATDVEVDLGFEPQYLLVKRATSSGGWFTIDNIRGLTVGDSPFVYANTSSAEDTLGTVSGFTPALIPTSTGFKLVADYGGLNQAGNTYTYMAIRKGMNPLGITV
jgi:hypothetical protein